MFKYFSVIFKDLILFTSVKVQFKRHANASTHQPKKEQAKIVFQEAASIASPFLSAISEPESQPDSIDDTLDPTAENEALSEINQALKQKLQEVVAASN